MAVAERDSSDEASPPERSEFEVNGDSDSFTVVDSRRYSFAGNHDQENC
jgi:hypothetical protein